jgi:hypothetical protein
MKKLTFTLAVAILCGFSSCVKNYNCVCEQCTANPGYPVQKSTFSTELPSASKKDAKSICEDDNDVEYCRDGDVTFKCALQ